MTRQLRPIFCGLLLSTALSLPAMAAQGPVVTRAQALSQLTRQSAQAGDSLRMHEGAFGTPRYLSGMLSGRRASHVSLEQQARAFLSGQSSLFPVVSDQLRLDRVMEDAAGGRHVRFVQEVDGVPVDGATLVVHLDGRGAVRAVSSSAVANLRLSTVPAVDEEEVSLVLEARYAESLLNLSEPELVIRADRSGSKLAWKVLVDLQDHLPMVVWVDAQNGEILFQDGVTRHAAATGTGINVLGQSITKLNMVRGRTFPVDVSPMLQAYIASAEKGAFNLVDLSKPDLGYIYTFTSNETYMMNIDYVNSIDNSFDSSRDKAHKPGVSAHDYFRQTLDTYKSRFNRNGIDNDGLGIAAIVQIDGIPGYPLECNAGWLGYGYNFMIFGMGGVCWDVEFYAFSAALDVIGHELSHGVDEFTINLGYNHESGALNEAFADIFGHLIEANSQTPDWLMGEDLFVTPAYPNDAIRSFTDPTLYGQPATMSQYYTAPVSYDAGGVHYNSGIINKAFQLMVDGGTFGGVTVPKIGTSSTDGRWIAASLWYDVMASERISNISQFIDVRDALVDAAEQLNPSKVAVISAAFAAVGVVDSLYPTATQDATEPNDYPGLAVPLTVGQAVQGRIWARNDADIYSVALEADKPATFTLSGLTFDGALGLYSNGLYDTLANEGNSNNAGTANETITVTPKTRGTYYVEVIPVQNAGSATQPYTLTVTQ